MGNINVQRDAAAIERLVAAEYSFAQPDTRMSGKAELPASIRPENGFVYLQHGVEEIDVRRYGITGVSNGRFMVRGQYKANVVAHRVRFTAVHCVGTTGGSSWPCIRHSSRNGSSTVRLSPPGSAVYRTHLEAVCVSD